MLLIEKDGLKHVLRREKKKSTSVENVYSVPAKRYVWTFTHHTVGILVDVKQRLEN